MTGRPPIRVLIVDDQILMRRGLRKLLEIEDGLDVVGEAADGADALAVLGRTGADVALVDARMPRMDGVTLIARLGAEHPRVAALVLTTFDDDDSIFGALRAGAKGYLLKDTPPEELVDAIGRAARGETVLGSPAAERVVAALRGAAPAPARSPADAEGDLLSEREREIAELVGTGAPNREIARRLFITEGTVKNHISSILRKWRLRDRTQLAVRVNRGGS
ncbi:LuxR family two component transcriptional regulator [Murinocardiopsis flavida]|uniref:LuxR family two component transcriptional regulator n=1 Tax=Murinocardiopsis flavida TaxID=645275 RepID=A0A2P8DKS7_9ACTN|nr:response regulator transcription factor [Murinocardiopsis flavida]PSK97827.1 LuxR family two component transcriptional regulator [Murinocardiopsis flavida]